MKKTKVLTYEDLLKKERERIRINRISDEKENNIDRLAKQIIIGLAKNKAEE